MPSEVSSVCTPHTRSVVAIVAGFVLMAVLAAPSSSAAGQPGATPTGRDGSALTGAVKDATGLPIAGAVVVVRSEASGLERVVRTDAGGVFAFRDLRDGAYQVVASQSGFAATALAVTVPAPEPLRLVLTLAPYEEAVTVVSAARQDRLRDATASPVTVINGDAMRDAGYETVAEALREVAGVVTRRGSEGAGAAGEQMQGIDSRQVLVLIDGQPVVGARGVKSGVVNLDRESILRLDRVEIVKGAASALYGSDAIGGVINMITREPRHPLELGAQISGGGHGVADAAADAGGLGRWGTIFVTAGRHQQDAFDLTPTTPDTTGAAFTRQDVSGHGSAALSARWLLTGTATSFWNKQTGRSVGELGPEEDLVPSNAQTFGGRAEWRAMPTTTAEFRAYRGRYSETAEGTLLNATRTPLAPGDLYQGLSKVDGSVAQTIGDRQQVRGGLEWIRDEYRGQNRIRDAEGNTATTGVAWGQYEVNPASSVTLTTGVRVDDHSAFGTAVSPKMAAAVRLTERVRVRASFGRGFRAPDLGQLYYRFLNPTNLYQVIGNPLLRPERSNSVQVGMDLRAGARGRIGLNFFHNDVTNLIESSSLGVITSPAQLAAVIAAEHLDPAFNVQLNRLLFVYKNVTEARTQGAELEGDVRFRTMLRLSGSYAYVDAVNQDTGQTLTGRNRQQGTVRVDWTPARLGLRANLRGSFYSSWIVSRTTTAAGTAETRAPKFALWDLSVSKPLVGGAELFGAIENLANSQDPNTGMLSATGGALPIYRPEIGRTWRGGVKWSWAK